MSENGDVKDRLVNSESVRSLRAEQDIVAAFKRLDWWHVEHGPFFRDGDTGKLRELDVRARRSWSNGSQSDGTDVTLEVLVEVKSLRGYHLVFAPEPYDYRDSRAQRAWLGYSKDRLARFLSEAGLAPDLIGRMVTRFNELAYPDGIMVTDKLVVNPPQASAYATAFRETNIGSEKELEASVLWKAIQGLTSAIESSGERRIATFLSNLGSHIEFARLDGVDLLSSVERELASAVRRLTLIHPTVVLDARLWLSTDGELHEVEQVRFVVQDPDKFTPRWFDIVTRKSFSQWVDQLTTHYSSRLEHPDEHIWRGSARSLQVLMDTILDPNLEIELKVKKRNSRDPAKRILWRTYSRRKKKKGARPVDAEKSH